MELFSIPVRFTVKAPFISLAQGAKELGYDATVLRHDGKAAIPGTLLKGVIQEQLKDILKEADHNAIDPGFSKSDVEHWFGVEGESRSCMVFDFYWLSTRNLMQNPRRITRIEIDHDNRKIKSGSLQVIESLFPLGQNIEFTGAVKGILDASETDKIVLALKKALSLVDAIGAFKTIGFGSVSKWCVKDAEVIKSGKVRYPSSKKSSVIIKFELDRPFCFAKPRAKNNTFDSELFIPGSAIKASLARILKSRNKDINLRDIGFDDLIVRHGFSTSKPKNERSEKMPLDFVAWKSDKEPTKLNFGNDRLGNVCRNVRVIQPGEWKANLWDAFSKRNTGAPYWDTFNFPRLLSIHNHYATSVGEDGLFSYRCIDSEKRQWASELIFSEIDQPERLVAELEEILSLGVIPYLGKTNAFAQITVMQARPKLNPRKQPRLKKFVVLALQSDAVLFAPVINKYAESEISSVALKSIYQSYFCAISENKLELVDFWARQKLSSGGYKYVKKVSQCNYEPYWLTEAGSVFKLEVKDLSVSSLLDQWSLIGLPVASCYHERDYTEFPYGRENGFGEVKIDFTQQ